MKVQIALVLVMGISGTAAAETIGGSFMFGGEAPYAPAPAPAATPRPPAPVPVPAPAPVRTSEVIVKPLPPVKPIAPVTQTVSPPTGEVPFQARIDIGSTRCPDPIPHPNARNTPVKVYVDQQNQSVSIVTPDRPQPVTSVVSTGGGLKIPSAKSGKPPYCAKTPAQDRMILSAVKPEMFKGTGCTEAEVRARSTVFPVYKSGTFTDKQGQEVPMPDAVRIVDHSFKAGPYSPAQLHKGGGGIFFHEVPPSYREMLGHNVSGECVRLAPSIAKFMRAQIEKYGAIEVVMGQPPVVGREKPQYCDEDTKLAALRKQQDPTAAAQPTGTEGVFGGENNFFTMLGRLFTPPQQPASARPQQLPPRPSRNVGRG